MELRRVHRLNAVVLTATLLAVAIGLSGLHPLRGLGPGVRIVTGLVLLAVLFWMGGIVLNRHFHLGTPARDVVRHRQLAVVAVLLFLIHATAGGYLWTHALWLLFVVAAVSAFVARSQMRFATRRGFLTQYGVHTLAGAIALAVGVWHGVVAVAFR